MEEKNVIERIKKYIQWPLWFGAYWLAMAIIFRFAIGRGAALVCVFGGAAYMACAAFMYNREKTRCASGLIRLAAEYGQIQNKLLKSLRLLIKYIYIFYSFTVINLLFLEKVHIVDY